ncbi:cyclic nucleotide-binding domain-containing protein [Paradevosia shaoguanensis]|uniref:cyclic nucleotide-binding domain-containing protein n=1 Tax=Paradevosia shaoguanensis TaxID=1335043 RepID=UPI00068C4BD7|nr:cyclic nucleotide-binding domain-containing protein [Paradevosia shaoguanensis]QMV00111.1 cyclic nucleotide-binding domain-containing protein [Devosia sp. D6-9]
MQLDDAATILAHAEFFEICDHDQRRLLAFASERRRFDANAVVYKAGDVPDGAHVLISGRLRSASEEGGKPHDLSGEGTLVGAMALVIAKPRPVTITALVASETLFVPRHAFLKLATQYPDLAARAADHIRRELTGYLGALAPLKGRIRKDQI